MVRISKRIIKTCKKMTDYYVRILNVPKLKTVTLLLMPIVFSEEEATVLDDVLVEQIELVSQLVFMKIEDDIPQLVDEIPDQCDDEVIDEIRNALLKANGLPVSNT